MLYKTFIIILLLILTTLGDIITTYIGICMGYSEINVISSNLMANNTFYITIRFVLLVIGIIGLLLANKTNNFLKRTIYISSYLTIIVFSIAIINNLLLIL